MSRFRTSLLALAAMSAHRDEIEMTAVGCRQAQRKVKTSTLQTNRLKSKINDLVGSPQDKKATEELQRTSIQVIYWIVVRRAEAVIPLMMTHSSASPHIIAMQEWLVNQPPSFLSVLIITISMRRVDF